MKVLYIDYENAGVFKVYENETALEEDKGALEAINDERADAFRFSNRASGLFERCEIDSVDEDDDGNPLDEVEYSIDGWQPVESKDQ